MPGLTLIPSAILLAIVIAGVVRHFRNRARRPHLEPLPRREDDAGDPDDSDLGDEPVILAKFFYPHEAEAARAALGTEYIDSHVEHDKMPMPSYAPWVTLWVARRDLEAARRALQGTPHGIRLPTPGRKGTEPGD